MKQNKMTDRRGILRFRIGSTWICCYFRKELCTSQMMNVLAVLVYFICSRGVEGLYLTNYNEKCALSIIIICIFHYSLSNCHWRIICKRVLNRSRYILFPRFVRLLREIYFIIFITTIITACVMTRSPRVAEVVVVVLLNLILMRPWVKNYTEKAGPVTIGGRSYFSPHRPVTRQTV